MSLNADGTTSDKETLEERTDATPQRILPSFLRSAAAYSVRWMAEYCWRSIDGQLNFGHHTYGPLPQDGPPPIISYKSLIGEQSIGGPSLVSADGFQFYVFWTRTDPEGQLDYRLLPP